VAVGSDSKSVRPNKQCTRGKMWPQYSVGTPEVSRTSAARIPQKSPLRAARRSHVQKNRTTTSDERCQARQTLPGAPNVCSSHRSSVSWSTVSKAAERSSGRSTPTSPRSNSTFRRSVSLERNGLKHYWNNGNRFAPRM
jgi:hypothetical protein